MCRFLYIAGTTSQQYRSAFDAFAAACKRSPEYQGHGHGAAWLSQGHWALSHQIQPIWESTLPAPALAQHAVFHARSAFRNEGITVENNMPFSAGNIVFAFNGELHGVRLREQGRTGAEKIFNVIRSCYSGDWGLALQDAMRLITSRTRYVRAMNVLLADETRAYVYSDYSESPEYFTLHVHRGQVRAVCSEPLEVCSDWESLPRKSVEIF